MAKRYIQPPYSTRVANFTRPAGVDGRPTKSRIGFTQQTSVEGGKPGVNLATGLPSASTASIVVADNDFSAVAKLTLGDFTLVSGVQYAVGASTALTAVNLAAAINNLPGFTAPVPGASTISVSGPNGPFEVALTALYGGAITNFTLTPDSGVFTVGGPAFGPPAILT